MAENSVSIKIKGDSSGAEKAIKSAEKSLKSLSKQGASALKSLAGFGSAATGFEAAASAIGKAGEAVRELSEAYAEQRTAELQLEQAARNNPYLDSEAADALKSYAKEASSLSGIAEKDLLPAMAQLAASGRKQGEIMKIVSAAADMAASGTTSFSGACSALNKTFSGTAGSLAEIVPGVRGLAKEQLEAGAAVDAVAKAYEGMAEAVSKADGGARRLQNAIWGLKAELGASLAEPAEKASGFFAGIAESVTGRLRKAREWKEALAEAEAIASKGEAERTAAESVQMYATRLEKVKREIAGIAESWKLIAAESLPAEEAERFVYEKVSLSPVMVEGADVRDPEIIALYKEQRELLAALAEAEAALAEEGEREARAAEEAAAAEAAAAEAAERRAAADAANSAAEGAIANWRERVRLAEQEIEVRRALGEEISRLEELESLSATKVSAAVDLMREAEGNVTLANRFFVGDAASGMEGLIAELERDFAEIERLREEAAESAEEAADGAEGRLAALKEALAAAMPGDGSWREASDGLVRLSELFEEARDAIPEGEAEGLAEELERAKRALAEGGKELAEWERLLKDAEGMSSRAAELEILAKEAAAEGKLELERAYLEEAARLNEEALERQKKADDAYIQGKRESLKELFSQMSGWASQIAGAVGEASSLMTETLENRLSATLSSLEAAYLRGEMDEEAYNEAVQKAKKETAQKEYKAEMWEWGASILQATANIAQGVTQAIAQGGVLGLITGAIVSAAGAAQVAAIVASKPTPPSFSTGGIVGGASYTGDRVSARVNSGEMILNAAQQRNLFDSISSGRLGGAGGVSVVVNNSAANIASATPEVTESQIMLMIDARVNESMKKGRYNKALTQAEQLKQGKWYGT